MSSTPNKQVIRSHGDKTVKGMKGNCNQINVNTITKSMTEGIKRNLCDFASKCNISTNENSSKINIEFFNSQTNSNVQRRFSLTKKISFET